MPKGLDTLREASESTEEYLPPILPCNWFWDVLIMRAWIHRFDCIEKNWQLLIPILSVPIYHLPRSLLSPPSITISYHITSIQCLNGPDNCPNLHVGFSVQYSHQPLGNEGRCQLSMPQCQHMVSTIVWPDNFCDLPLFGDLLLPCTNPLRAAFLVTHNCVTALRI